MATDDVPGLKTRLNSSETAKSEERSGPGRAQGVESSLVTDAVVQTGPTQPRHGLSIVLAELDPASVTGQARAGGLDGAAGWAGK